MTPLDAVIDSLATFRLARLVTRDDFPPIRRARERWWRRYPDDGWPVDEMFVERAEGAEGTPHVGEQAEYRDGRIELNVVRAGNEWVAEEGHPLGILVGCSWCSSVWLAFGVVTLRRVAPRFWSPVAKALAFSAVAGLLSRGED